ncbi:MAG: TonB-dependent receptor plug domain-containing protein, partial [Planctomycetota bacterium]
MNFELMGQFDDQEEFVVEKVETVGGTELGLLQLRAESPALLDSISSELISRAGAGDAGAALKLISGATVQDGKYAVVRGLPDRYVNSQLYGIRLPTADADKRAVELDQFPSTVIRTIEVSKTFTPDQQGDASGGAVNMVLKGVPDVTYFSFKASTRWNSQASGRSDFLSYDGGGVGDFGFESDSRTTSRVGPYFEGLGGGTPDFNFVVDRPGALGVSTIQSPIQGGFTLAAGGREELSSSIPLIGGGLLGLNTSVFYNRDASYYDDGINDRWSREGLDAGMAPADTQQTAPEEFLTRVYDVTRASQSVNWGGFASLTLELDNTNVALNYLYTRDVSDTAVLATNTRGRDFYLDPAFDGN